MQTICSSYIVTIPKGLLRNNLFKLLRSIFCRSPRRDRSGIANAYAARIATQEFGKKTNATVQVILQQALRVFHHIAILLYNRLLLWVQLGNNILQNIQIANLRSYICIRFFQRMYYSWIVFLSVPTSF